MKNLIVFNDSYYSQGFEEGVEFINTILEKHGLQINLEFIEDYESDDGEFAHLVTITQRSQNNGK